MQLTIAAILTAGRESPDAVTKLCAGLTDGELRAEIEGTFTAENGALVWHRRTKARDARQARAALETERDRRTKAAMIATLPEDKRL